MKQRVNRKYLRSSYLHITAFFSIVPNSYRFISQIVKVKISKTIPWVITMHMKCIWISVLNASHTTTVSGGWIHLHSLTRSLTKAQKILRAYLHNKWIFHDNLPLHACLVFYTNCMISNETVTGFTNSFTRMKWINT